MQPLGSRNATPKGHRIRRALLLVGNLCVVATFGVLISDGMKGEVRGAAIVADGDGVVVRRDEAARCLVHASDQRESFAITAAACLIAVRMRG